MCNKLELSWLFVYLVGLIKFFSAWEEQKKLLGCGFAWGISTQADTMANNKSIFLKIEIIHKNRPDFN